MGSGAAFDGEAVVVTLVVVVILGFPGTEDVLVVVVVTVLGFVFPALAALDLPSLETPESGALNASPKGPLPPPFR